MGPTIVKGLKDAEALEGIPFDLVCEASATPKPEITWYLNETQIIESDHYSLANTNNTYSLTIKSPTDLNTGLYKAVFKNDLGTSETKSTVTLLIPPTFVKPLEELYTGSLTKTSELLVQINARPAAKLKILKDNKEIKASDHFKFESANLNENLIEFRLIIDNIQATDAGTYKIEATNKCLTQSSQTQFIVKGEPAFNRKPTDVTVPEKKQARFDCEVVGVPIPTVEWYKDGELLEKSDNIVMESKGKGINTMFVKSVTPKNIGTYTIKAKNESGEAETSFTLSVDGNLFPINIIFKKYLFNLNSGSILDHTIER